ncbi:MAG: 23S rRNA (uracil-C(5))-methyltransferase RlmCD [Chloroflexi bacterium ADurb.Bin325]|nr:MAG: 23S rRNA (uracil-C(5))-methyltransferase RlmCD [Chloroflexi bacterium ADurb.Bin325]
MDILIESLAHGGEGIGRGRGKAVFVPYTIPGERVRVEIVEEKERWARGRLVEVLAASPDRVEPPCPYFGPDRCGGCQWQHIRYERQAELKQAIVIDQLRRLGRLPDPPVADTVVMADPADDGRLLDYGYRNQTQFMLDADGRLSFRRTDAHGLIAVERCLLLADRLDELHAALDLAAPALTGVSLRAGLNTDDALILFEAAGDDAPELELDLPAACALRTPAGLRPLIGEPFIMEEVGGRRYRIAADSPFPANTAAAAALVEIVAAYADPQPADILLDAFCGVGLFALALAGQVAEVIGVEASASACEDFASNAGDLPRVSLHEGPVAEVLPALLAAGQRADLVILEPPRTGAGQATLRDLAALAPRRMIYISHDPASLARDVEHLHAAGYRIAEVQPVDLLPQTQQVTCVARIERA